MLDHFVEFGAPAPVIDLDRGNDLAVSRQVLSKLKQRSIRAKSWWRWRLQNQHAITNRRINACLLDYNRRHIERSEQRTVGRFEDRGHNKDKERQRHHGADALRKEAHHPQVNQILSPPRGVAKKP